MGCRPVARDEHRIKDHGPKSEVPGSSTEGQETRKTEGCRSRTQDIKDPGSRREGQETRKIEDCSHQGQWMESKPWMKAFYKLNYRYVKIYEIFWVAEVAQ